MDYKNLMNRSKCEIEELNEEIKRDKLTIKNYEFKKDILDED